MKKKKRITKDMTDNEFRARVRKGCVCGSELHVRIKMNEDMFGGVEYGGAYVACDNYIFGHTCEYYIGGRWGSWREVDLEARAEKE